MTFEEKVLKAHELDSAVEEAELNVANATNSLKSAKDARDALYLELLTEAKVKGVKDQQVEDLFITYFSKEDITWLNDEALLKKLQENKDTQFIKTTVKTTVSVDKNALKKAFKADEAIKEEYKEYYGNKLIEYVIVTTSENHEKMLEHIKEGK